jgi:hypothetical protein
MEGLGQLKNPMTSPGIEPATFLLIAYASTNYATTCLENMILTSKKVSVKLVNRKSGTFAKENK